MTRVITFILSLIFLALTLLLSACTYTVGGDSTMHHVAAWTGAQEWSKPGCGWTGNHGYPSPCTIPLNPPNTDRVILGVSIWDADAPDYSAYRHVTNYYNAHGAEVIWVAVPEMTGSFEDYRTLRSTNAAVAAELGCDLAPWRTRWVNGEMLSDNIHYTDHGARLVAERFETLKSPVCR